MFEQRKWEIAKSAKGLAREGAYLATHKDNQSKTKPKFKQNKSKPGSDLPSGKARTAEEVVHTVMRRRKNAPRTPGALDVTAMLIAERSERDDELAEQIARSVAGRRRSTAHVEDDLGNARDAKHARITVRVENALIRSAQSYTGIKNKSVLIRIALTQLVEREAARTRRTGWHNARFEGSTAPKVARKMTSTTASRLIDSLGEFAVHRNNVRTVLQQQQSGY